MNSRLNARPITSLVITYLLIYGRGSDLTLSTKPKHKMREEQTDQFRFLGNCPPTPPLRKTLTITSNLGQNVGLGDVYYKKETSRTLNVTGLNALLNARFTKLQRISSVTLLEYLIVN